MPTVRTSLAVVLVAAACALSGCASSGSNVLGRSVTLVPKAPKEPKTKGELLAVEDGRIWVRTREGSVREFEQQALRDVQVQRHDLGGGRALTIGVTGGVLSAVALTVSCSRVEGNSGSGCAAVGGIVGGLFALTGVLASLALDTSAQAHVSPEDLALRAYARFPGGWPRDVAPNALAGPNPPESRHPK